MANTDAPFGLEPLYGTYNQNHCHLYRITNNYGTALFIQDPVRLEATGTIEQPAVTGEYFVGVIVAVFLSSSQNYVYPTGLLPVNYYAASPGATYDYWAMVMDNPNAQFRVQDDGSGTLTYTDLGLNADVIWTHTGNTTSGISQMELDVTTAATTNTFPLRMLALSSEWDAKAGAWNAPAAVNAKWIVKINLHQLNYTTGL